MYIAHGQHNRPPIWQAETFAGRISLAWTDLPTSHGFGSNTKVQWTFLGGFGVMTLADLDWSGRMENFHASAWRFR